MYCAPPTESRYYAIMYVIVACSHRNLSDFSCVSQTVIAFSGALLPHFQMLRCKNNLKSEINVIFLEIVDSCSSTICYMLKKKVQKILALLFGSGVWIPNFKVNRALDHLGPKSDF